MNIVKEVAKLLGIEVGVPFSVNENNTIYCLRDNGKFEWADWGGMLIPGDFLANKFLCGNLTVKWTPKEESPCYIVDPREKSGVYKGLYYKDNTELLRERGLVFRTEEEAIAKAKELGWVK